MTTNPVELTKLIDNLTKQEQRKCELETKLKIIMKQNENFRNDISNYKHKEELLECQLQDKKKDISKLKIENTNLETKIQDQRMSSSRMQLTYESMSKKISSLIQEIDDIKQVHTTYCIDIQHQFDINNKNIEEALI